MMDEPIAHRGVEEDLHDDLRAMVKAELRPGERLLWSARPMRPPITASGGCSTRTGLIWTGGSACLFLASCLVGSGVLGKMDNGIVAIASIIAIFSGLSALVFGAIMAIVLLSLRVAYRDAASTLYAITDRRGLIWRERPRTGMVEVYTLGPRSLRSIHRIERADGSGDVIFEAPAPGTLWKPNQGFAGVVDVRRVEGLAREILLDPEARPRHDENRA